MLLSLLPHFYPANIRRMIFKEVIRKKRETEMEKIIKLVRSSRVEKTLEYAILVLMMFIIFMSFMNLMGLTC
jgi:hypothetical protein